MAKYERVIIEHIGNMQGQTSPTIAYLLTPYAYKTCKRVFNSVARRNKNYPGHYSLK